MVSEAYLLNELIFKNIDKLLSDDEKDRIVNNFFNYYERAKLLIIKDVGENRVYKKESFGIMFLLLNQRYIDHRPTIFTTKLKLEDIPDYFRQSYNDFKIEGLETYYFDIKDDKNVNKLVEL